MKTTLSTLALCVFSMVGYTQELIPFEDENGKWGYQDEKRDVIIQPEYDCAYRFHYGEALVQIGNNFGVINPKNEKIEPVEYAIDTLVSYKLPQWYYAEYAERQIEAYRSEIDSVKEKVWTFSTDFSLGGWSCDYLFKDLKVTTIHGYLLPQLPGSQVTYPFTIGTMQYAVVTNVNGENGIILCQPIFGEKREEQEKVIYEFTNAEISSLDSHPNCFIVKKGGNKGLIKVTEDYKVITLFNTEYFDIQPYTSSEGSFFEVIDIKFTYKNIKTGETKVFNHNEIPSLESGWTFVKRDQIENNYDLDGNLITD
jgi:hypothetical protein